MPLRYPCRTGKTSGRVIDDVEVRSTGAHAGWVSSLGARSQRAGAHLSIRPAGPVRMRLGRMHGCGREQLLRPGSSAPGAPRAARQCVHRARAPPATVNRLIGSGIAVTGFEPLAGGFLPRLLDRWPAGAQGVGRRLAGIARGAGRPRTARRGAGGDRGDRGLGRRGVPVRARPSGHRRRRRWPAWLARCVLTARARAPARRPPSPAHRRDVVRRDDGGLLDHPWIGDRRAEVEAQLDRLEAVVERARATPRPDVICHTDFGGHNALVDDDTSEVVAILDWDHARLAPASTTCGLRSRSPTRSPTSTPMAATSTSIPPTSSTPSSRALRDATARLATERDREGVETWGFARWRRLDRNLALLRRSP